MPVKAEGATMKLDVTLHDLAAIREFVKVGAVKAKLTPEKVHEVMVAVDEAVTNIIVHGYQKKAGPLEVKVGARKKQFNITIRDQAPTFNPLVVPPPDTTLPIEKRPIGGMGVHLIKNAMDGVDYHPLPGGGNELIMTIRL